jgi:hypothetical protein
LYGYSVKKSTLLQSKNDSCTRLGWSSKKDLVVQHILVCVVLLFLSLCSLFFQPCADLTVLWADKYLIVLPCLFAIFFAITSRSCNVSSRFVMQPTKDCWGREYCGR